METPLHLPAPAKINLYLHVTGRRADGYHLLDSLVAFTDLGDEITIAPADDFALTITGPFAGQTPQADNLVEKTARILCARFEKAPAIHITLTKNLPVGSGIGGGSSDAAATARGLCTYFGIEDKIGDILLSLGADIPACYRCAPLRFLKIGEELQDVTDFPALPVLLANPLIPCPTRKVFQAIRAVSDGDKTALPPLGNQDALFRFLQNTRNDLTEPASHIVPTIQTVLDALRASGASLARMSGSGATCFALYESEADCRAAAARLRQNHPGWWIQSTRLQGSAPN